MPGFADAGLAMQGATAAQRDLQDVETRRQANETGRIGIENLQRTNDTAESVRQAGVRGQAAGQDMGGTFEDMATAAAQRGDMKTALELRQARKQLEDEGIKNVIHKALIDPRPGKRPDLAAEFNRYGQRRDMPDDVELDEKGNLWATDPKTGKRGSINVGLTAERLGMVKAPTLHNVPSGGIGVLTGPGVDPTNPKNQIRADAMPKFELKDGILYNERTGAWQQVDTKGKWTLGKITHGNSEVPVAINSDTGAVNLLGPGGVRTGLDAHITQPTTPGGSIMVTLPGGAVSEFKPGTEGTPAKTNVFSPNEPAKPGEPAKLQPVSSPENPPIEGARKAADGKWYVRSGDGYAEVVVNAKPGAPAAKAAPKAEPKPATAPKPARSAPTAKAETIPAGGEFEGVETPMQKAKQAVSGAAQAVSGAFDRSTKQQVDFYKKKITDGKLDARDRNVVAALAKSHPEAFSASELKMAGVRGYADGGKVEKDSKSRHGLTVTNVTNAADVMGTTIVEGAKAVVRIAADRNTDRANEEFDKSIDDLKRRIEERHLQKHGL